MLFEVEILPVRWQNQDEAASSVFFLRDKRMRVSSSKFETSFKKKRVIHTNDFVSG